MTGQKKSPWALFNVATVLPRLSPGGPAAVPWSSFPPIMSAALLTYSCPSRFLSLSNQLQGPQDMATSTRQASMPVSLRPGSPSCCHTCGSGRALSWEAGNPPGPRLGLCARGAVPAPLRDLRLLCLHVLRNTLTANVEVPSTALGRELPESEAHDPAQGLSQSAQTMPVGHA